MRPITTRARALWATLKTETRIGRYLTTGEARPTPIGYLAMCQDLLNAGIHVKTLLQHRFVIEALAAGSYVHPIMIDYDERHWSFVLRDGNRTLYCEFQKISTKATYQMRFDDVVVSEGRLALAHVLSLMLLLHPLERSYTRWEKIRLWFARKFGPAE